MFECLEIGGSAHWLQSFSIRVGLSVSNSRKELVAGGNLAFVHGYHPQALTEPIAKWLGRGESVSPGACELIPLALGQDSRKGGAAFQRATVLRVASKEFEQLRKSLRA